MTLRDDHRLRGLVSVPAGQTLIRFLWTRSNFLNLTDVTAEWLEPPSIDHLAVQLHQIAWVMSADGQIPLKPVAAMPLLVPVELRLERGIVLRGSVDVAFNERFSDLLDTEGPFLPVLKATQLGGPTLGDVAVGIDCIIAAHELPGP